MLKKFLLVFFILINSHNLFSQEISEWFDQESNGFLELMKNSNTENKNNFDQYLNYVRKNFAIKSIAFSLINEKIIQSSDQSTLDLYLHVFENYLTKTIYNLANPTYSGNIELLSIDQSDGIYIISSEISDGSEKIDIYWKVALFKDGYKIIDVIIENTSYFVTKKTEFSKILRKNKNDIGKLILELENI